MQSTIIVLITHLLCKTRQYFHQYDITVSNITACIILYLILLLVMTGIACIVIETSVCRRSMGRESQKGEISIISKLYDVTKVEISR